MWYRTGTVNLTNGSATVIGVGTAFVGAVQPGGVFVGPNAAVYEVLEVVSATQLTLRTPYLGSTTAGSAYGGIFPTYAALVKLTSDIALLLGEYAGVKDNAGAGKFGDGTAAVPGLRFSADEDTGIRRAGANALALVTGGADRLVVTNAGATLTGLLTGTGVMQGSTDATAGRLMTVGAFGTGGTELPNAADPNAITISGKYRVFGSANMPSTVSFVLEHFQRFSAQAVQIAYLMGSPQRIYQRQFFSGVWSAWRTYSETVGAVTQFGGLATGACMEAGTNANGRFERFAHGVQECWQPALTAPNSNTVFGSRWRSADVTWNFPASFLTGAVPAISAVCIDGDSDARVLSVTNTTAVLRVVSDISKSGAITIHVRAKGRWADITG